MVRYNHKNTIMIKSEKISETKNMIIDVAEGLFAKFGYLGVSMADIANNLEITKAALYYHYKSKKEIYLKVLSSAFEDFSKDISNVVGNKKLPIEKRFCSMIAAYINFSLDKKDLAMLTMHKLSKDEDGIMRFIDDLKSKIVGQLEPTVREFLVYKKRDFAINSEIATHLLIGMLNTIILGEVAGGKKSWKSEDIAKQINAMFF